MISIIKQNGTTYELTADNYLSYCLDVIKDNNYPQNSFQTLYTSLRSQSQYSRYNWVIGLYGTSNIKATLSTNILVIIKRFYSSILLILNSYLEILEKIVYTKKQFIILPIYPKIIFFIKV